MTNRYRKTETKGTMEWWWAYVLDTIEEELGEDAWQGSEHKIHSIRWNKEVKMAKLLWNMARV